VVGPRPRAAGVEVVVEGVVALIQEADRVAGRNGDFQPVVGAGRQGGRVEGVGTAGVGGGSAGRPAPDQLDRDAGRPWLAARLAAVGVGVAPDEVPDDGGYEAVLKNFQVKPA